MESGLFFPVTQAPWQRVWHTDSAHETLARRRRWVPLRNPRDSPACHAGEPLRLPGNSLVFLLGRKSQRQAAILAGQESWAEFNTLLVSFCGWLSLTASSADGRLLTVPQAMVSHPTKRTSGYW